MDQGHKENLEWMKEMKIPWTIFIKPFGLLNTNLEEFTGFFYDDKPADVANEIRRAIKQDFEAGQ